MIRTAVISSWNQDTFEELLAQKLNTDLAGCVVMSILFSTTWKPLVRFDNHTKGDHIIHSALIVYRAEPADGSADSEPHC